MDLRQLSSFIAVAEEGQLSKAAVRLNLSQPPLSRHIQALEEELGVRLFDRTTAGMELTQAGMTLLGDARNIESLIHQASKRVRRAGMGQSGQLSVGVYGSSIYGVVPRILQQFKQAYPEVELVLHYAQTPAQVLALRHGRVQIVFERMVPKESDIAVQLVCREKLLLALNASHPLAQRESIHMSELKDEVFIPGTEFTASSRVVEISREAGFIPRLAPASSNVVTATLLAGIGTGVSIVPESMVNVSFPGISYRELKLEGEHSMDLYCFYLEKDTSPLVANMLGIVNAFAAHYGQGASDE